VTNRARSIFLTLQIIAWLASLLAIAPAVEAQRVRPNVNVPLVPPAASDYAAVAAFPGLKFPGLVHLATIPGNTNSLLLLDRVGRVLIIPDVSRPAIQTVLDIQDRVFQWEEGGLLGIACHPGFQTNGFMYLYYTANTNKPNEVPAFFDRISRFHVHDRSSWICSAGSETPIISQRDTTGHHNAGDLKFGPDGYLYASFGDESLPDSISIDRSLFSSIIRIDVDGRPGNLVPNAWPGKAGSYWIPADNPFVQTTRFWGRQLDKTKVRTELYAVGLRNPVRFGFHPDGRLFAGDTGQIKREEINLVLPGRHYGWRLWEGTIRYDPAPIPAGQEMVPPIHEWGGDGLRGCAIGGIVYRGNRLPELNGQFLFADWSRGFVKAIRQAPDGTWPVQTVIPHSARAVAFGEDPSNRDVLIVARDTAGTAVLRIVRSTPSAQPFPARLSDTKVFQDMASLTPAAGLRPYDVNVPFWSDGAIKRRWFSILDPNQKVTWRATANWSFPRGSLWVKHFDYETIAGDPASRRRIETRLLVNGSAGFYGVTYRWNAEQTDAFLVDPSGETDEIGTTDSSGKPGVLRWRYPSQTQCMTCHYEAPGFALGFNTAQLNKDVATLDGTRANQLALLHREGWLNSAPADPAGLPKLYDAGSGDVTVEVAARSFLASNCAYCHQWYNGGAGRGMWDARITMPLSRTLLTLGTPADRLGNTTNTYLVPGNTNNSLIHRRVDDMTPIHMPPLAVSGTPLRNDAGVSLLARWIAGTSFVVQRSTFYNGSVFDGWRLAVDDADDKAIAAGKTALLPGASAVFSNVTSYERGINGVIIDISRTAPGIGLGDFAFFSSTSGTNWLPASPPDQFLVRRGAGFKQSDRIMFGWSTNAVRNAWLKVVARSSPGTGLGADDEFYFGNSVGETGNDASRWSVDQADLNAVLAAAGSSAASSASIHDINRDGIVDTKDSIVVSGRIASGSAALAGIAPQYDGFVPRKVLAYGGPSSRSTVAGVHDDVGARVSAARGPRGGWLLRVDGTPFQRYWVERSDVVKSGTWRSVLSDPLEIPASGSAWVEAMEEAGDVGFFRATKPSPAVYPGVIRE